MATPTNEDLLAGARAAYALALQTGKSVTFNGRTYTSHDLPDLWTAVTSLENLVAGAGMGASRTRVAAYCKGV